MIPDPVDTAALHITLANSLSEELVGFGHDIATGIFLDVLADLAIRLTVDEDGVATEAYLRALRRGR